MLSKNCRLGIGNRPLWVGGADLGEDVKNLSGPGKKNKYYWLPHGEYVDDGYSNWRKNQPDNWHGKEH